MTTRDGSSYQAALILDRADLDLTQLRAHCREYHSHHGPARRRGGGFPRSNADLAGWHWTQHHRYRPRSHTHRGPWAMVRDRWGRTTGQIARPLGWFTGQDVFTAEQQREEFRQRVRPPR